MTVYLNSEPDISNPPEANVQTRQECADRLPQRVPGPRRPSRISEHFLLLLWREAEEDEIKLKGGVELLRRRSY